MAYTKIHPIKSTVHKAVAYICNPEKTDDQLLISSFGCAPETAHWDFAFTRQNAADQGENLAFHLIQAFAPGEVSQEEAHKIGQEMADQVLGGKYSYVVTTHIDKGHIHNHIIFSAVDNQEYKHYEDCKESYYRIRRLSDNLCKEHNLSVIEEHSGKRGKSWWQWNLSQNEDDPKVQLRRDINKCIQLTESFDEFVEFMKMKGYQIKLGKYISFGLPGTDRYIRGKANTLGKKYTKEQIQERIDNKPKINVRVSITRLQYLLEVPADILQNSENAGLRRWATKENLKRMAETYNQMVEQGIESFEELDDKIKKAKEKQKELKGSLKQMEQAQKKMVEMSKYLKQYQDTKEVYQRYEKAYFKDRFFRQHESEIIIYGAAVNYFRREGIKPDNVALSEMKNRAEKLIVEKSDLKKQVKGLEKQAVNLQIMQENIRGYLQADVQNRGKGMKSIIR